MNNNFAKQAVLSIVFTTFMSANWSFAFVPLVDQDFCEKKNQQYAYDYGIWRKALPLGAKLHTKKDPMYNKAKSYGFEDYTDIFNVAMGLRFATSDKWKPYEKKWKQKLYVTDVSTFTDGTVIRYNLIQRVEGLLIFLVTSRSFPINMPGPLRLAIKERSGDSPQKGDPLCLYGPYFKLVDSITMEMTDGFSVSMPLLEPVGK